MEAILPAAGKGTRMLAVTRGAPKETLPLAGRTVLQCVLDEATAAGCSRVAIVGCASKPELQVFTAYPRIRLAQQARPGGLAHAVVSAGSKGPALVLLPDCVYLPASPSPRLVEAIRQGSDIAIAVEPVPEEKVGLYGIVESDPQHRITRILEKPEPQQTSGRLAVAARYGFSARFMSFLADWVVERDDPTSPVELDITAPIAAAIDEGYTAVAVPLEPGERRDDCGSPEGYAEAMRRHGE